MVAESEASGSSPAALRKRGMRVAAKCFQGPKKSKPRLPKIGSANSSDTQRGPLSFAFHEPRAELRRLKRRSKTQLRCLRVEPMISWRER
jgi:hypothetical protein